MLKTFLSTETPSREVQPVTSVAEEDLQSFITGSFTLLGGFNVGTAAEPPFVILNGSNLC